MQAALVQRFDDIGIPAYGPYRRPTMEDLAIALDFARAVRDRIPEGVLAVHCQHGVPRSAAVALAIIADEAGPGAEANAVAALLRQDDDARMQPNPLIVSLADAALFRYGHLDAALAAVCPRYVVWRDHWRDIALDPGAYWEQARRVRLRPRRREV